jgi:exodeoxyribonuclease VII large subunit
MVDVVIFPVLVQGDAAAADIAAMIDYVDDHFNDIDTLIVGRGGGSADDLWAFNEEIVARAIFECEIPIVSAVGHETDTTIADYVSDLRAPTPSAAAELAVFDYRQIENQKMEYKLRMQRILMQRIEVYRLKLEKMETKIQFLHPENKLREYRQRLVDLEDKLRNTMQNHLQMKKYRFQIYLEKMNGLSPLQKLNQGFSYVETEEKNVLKSISQVKKGDCVSVYVTDGIIKASVEEVKEEQHG